ncbi:excinuclease ABC subunit UvrA [Treponema sp.]|uniref:excinuclease ABC subunit UvrA n=1 Tax=Treponema sp. TaxID=166 RepID=UPI0025CBD9C0|nr:excinuclease ABC subunit UvrA [Treponema sp.]MCR5218226.1 excinuclease ABC subunit UvrA [Treponema sp.]
MDRINKVPEGQEKIVIQGAREHNLKNINVEIPRNRLVVISGLSGSGKSSLAFDTLFAEGQRRYMESLSSYARQFLGRMDKPDVDMISGLSPAISIEQKSTNKNPRSTVGTVTEIYDYYRLLYARIGKAHCPKCGREINEQSVDQIIDTILSWDEGTKLTVLAPVIRGKKGEHVKVIEDAKKSGFVRARIDGLMVELEDSIKLDKQKKHTIEIVVDRIVLKDEIRRRLADSVETALNASNGILIVLRRVNKEDQAYAQVAAALDSRGTPYDREASYIEQEVFFSQKNACPDCGISIPDLQPRLFSFNNPFGACPDCTGIGEKMEWNENLIVPDKNLSFNQGGIAFYNPDSAWNRSIFEAVAEAGGFSLDTPLNKLTKAQYHYLWNGDENKILHWVYQKQSGEGYSEYKRPWLGVMADMKRRYAEAWGESQKERMQEKFMSVSECQTCHGKRLRPEALCVTVGGKNIWDLTELSVLETIDFFKNLSLTPTEQKIAAQILKEINSRLNFLKNVGLEYLTLHRSASTLSGGEAQRIRLSTQIGSGLTGVMYILDEPSIGLHQRDNERLIKSLTYLRDLGNTVIVVEHDEQTMLTADWLVDIGPGAGVHGGKIMASGTPAQVMQVEDSVTGKYLAGKLRMKIPEIRRKGNGNLIRIQGVTEHNLKNVSVDIPLGTFTCITGVSGSGKSTLLSDVFYPAASNAVMRTEYETGKYKKITGLENIDKVISIDQTPIGRTPRSNPVTYIGVFDKIRDLFASLPEAKAKGYKAGRFSFNVKGGRCENCEGAGTITIEMNFLPDVFIQCDVCHGKRFNQETLEVTYKGKSISDVLDMTIEDAADFFAGIPHIARKLETLKEVGLGYIQLGQNALTLSGGEAQRVKLASELCRPSTGKTLYILDEPTTGLHFADIMQLMNVIQRLVDKGNTVVMIEHNLDVICQSDYIIDLGPEGGTGGGEVIATGTPEEVSLSKKSYTGRFIKSMLEREALRDKKL